MYEVFSAERIHDSEEDIHIWYMASMFTAALVADVSSQWRYYPIAVVMQVHAQVLSSVVRTFVTQLCGLVHLCSLQAVWPAHDMLAENHLVSYHMQVHTCDGLLVPHCWVLIA